MAFVTCKQFNLSQEAQDKAFEELEGKTLSAEDSLLDKIGKQGGGKITVEKIKKVIAGDVQVGVKSGSGITGKGTKDEPLSLKTVRLVDASGSVHLGNILGA